MEKEFIPYEQALALKDLGFNEPCFGATFTYNSKINDYITFCGQSNYSGYKNSEGEEVRKLLKDEYYISRPTFSQAFRWFREKYNLRGFIGFRPNVKQFDCHVYDMSLSGKEYTEQRTMEEFNKDPKVGTHEEAELECLKKLIQIVKEK